MIIQVVNIVGLGGHIIGINIHDCQTSIECTLLVLIDFCPVLGELLTQSSVSKTFDTLPEIIIEYQI